MENAACSCSPSIYVTLARETRNGCKKDVIKAWNSVRLGRFGLDADASVENTTKAVAITTGAISHADTVTRSSVPDKCNDYHVILT
jgi:hypothetical protein